MSASTLEVRGMIARSRGAVPVTLQGSDPQTLHLPAGTRRVLLTPAPGSANLIDGVTVARIGVRPPEGYEVTLERHFPEWDSGSGIVGWPTDEDYGKLDEWLQLVPWPHSEAAEEAQIRTASGPLVDSGEEGRWVLDLATPARLVYGEGFWVLTERPD